mmetsp:Transcript_17806/g.30557  ORF Transcript_17806/g.30557 Transcript_17806/m.30557 type:complete len:158 (-) Transcript_17806:995-1468(-)
MDDMDEVLNKICPHLFIGSAFDEENAVILQKHGITHILQVAAGLGPSHPQLFQYCGIQVQDSPGEDLVAHFTRAFEFIDSAVAAQGACFVHCVAGISRSATVCIGWLMARQHLTYDQAFRMVHRVRPFVMPNPGFRQQLAIFESQNCDPALWRAVHA